MVTTPSPLLENGRSAGDRRNTEWAKPGFWLEHIDANGSISSKMWLTCPDPLLGPEHSTLAYRHWAHCVTLSQPRPLSVWASLLLPPASN